MKLTDSACRRAACPADRKWVRLADGRSLYLEVSNASKRWFLKYRKPDGKESRVALGAFPDVSLASAREKAQQAREQRADNKDPVQMRQQAKVAAQLQASSTFETVASATYDELRNAHNWSEAYAQRWWRAVEMNLLPTFRSRPVAQIEPPELLAQIRRIEARGVRETAHRVTKAAGLIFAHAIGAGVATRNPVTDIVDLLKPKPEVEHRAAVLDRKALGQMLRDLQDYGSLPGRYAVTQHACQIQMLTAQRPGNVQNMRWADVDLSKAVWSIPAANLKATKSAKGLASKKQRPRPAHLVFLSRQAVAILKAQKEAVGDASEFVFPSAISTKKPVSENTMCQAFKRMGFDASAHGARATFLTLVQEDLRIPIEHAEPVLAHQRGGKKVPTGAAYDRTSYLVERPGIMQRWADHLDALRDGGKVVPLRRGKA